jgi:hypothetical protein
MFAKQFIRLAHWHQNSRIGKFFAWFAIIHMAWIALACLANLVIRRYTGEQFDLTDALFLVIGFFTVRASRAVYFTLILQGHPRANGNK